MSTLPQCLSQDTCEAVRLPGSVLVSGSSRGVCILGRGRYQGPVCAHKRLQTPWPRSPAVPERSPDPYAAWTVGWGVPRSHFGLRLWPTICRETAELQAVTKPCNLEALTQPGGLSFHLPHSGPNRLHARETNLFLEHKHSSLGSRSQDWTQFPTCPGAPNPRFLSYSRGA